MLINFSRGVMGLDGKQLDGPGGGLTLRTACVEALIAELPSDKAATGQEKLKRWELARSIHAGADPIELKAEEVALIKKRIGEGFGAIVVGPAFRMLDGEDAPDTGPEVAAGGN